MRIVVFTAALLSMCLVIPGADLSGGETNPYIKLTHVIKDGTLRISAKNISHKPIVAYVVAFEDGGQSTTHHDFYTGRDVFWTGRDNRTHVCRSANFQYAQGLRRLCKTF